MDDIKNKMRKFSLEHNEEIKTMFKFKQGSVYAKVIIGNNYGDAIDNNIDNAVLKAFTQAKLAYE